MQASREGYLPRRDLSLTFNSIYVHAFRHADPPIGVNLKHKVYERARTETLGRAGSRSDPLKVNNWFVEGWVCHCYRFRPDCILHCYEHQLGYSAGSKSYSIVINDVAHQLSIKLSISRIAAMREFCVCVL